MKSIQIRLDYESTKMNFVTKYSSSERALASESRSN